MIKIISLFQRNYETDRLVRDEVTPGAEWVLNGEGIATRKWEGTPCMYKDYGLYKRYNAKGRKFPPFGFTPCQDPDPITGHWPGWIPITASYEDKYFIEALKNYPLYPDIPIPEGTYELCGPAINKNPEGFDKHVLVPHGKHIIDIPRTFYHIQSYLSVAGIEGIVWHHPDGRMVKIKAKDFGLKRTI